MVLGFNKTCVCQIPFYDVDSQNTHIPHCFVMHVLGICIKLNSYVADMFYTWSLSHKTALPIYMRQNKYFLSFGTYNTSLSQGSINLHKYIIYWLNIIISTI